MDEFHNILFPQDLGFSVSQKIERKVEMIQLSDGSEVRNTKNYASKRNFHLKIGTTSLEKIAIVAEFYEARRGGLVGFRWHDDLDYKSSSLNISPQSADQKIGTFDNAIRQFQLVKQYGDFSDQTQNYSRKITKPKHETVMIKIGERNLTSGEFSVDNLTGIINIDPAVSVVEAVDIYAGFEFDVPVRFDEQSLNIDFVAFEAGKVTELTLTEILD